MFIKVLLINGGWLNKGWSLTSTYLAAGLMSSLGTMSMRKSNWSYLVMAMAMSFLCRVLLLLSSVCTQARMVNSWMNISHALPGQLIIDNNRLNGWRLQMMQYANKHTQNTPTWYLESFFSFFKAYFMSLAWINIVKRKLNFCGIVFLVQVRSNEEWEGSKIGCWTSWSVWKV